MVLPVSVTASSTSKQLNSLLNEFDSWDGLKKPHYTHRAALMCPD
jgi:hypothetical protein